ncbi:hypothetical protein HELRODRAFT_126833, partial [Helobdella robusta]|uniref:Somatostatin/Cortistatin C-terminal domain-containing protein n=1 Tax=Helobdella robusta TaxID=6412 RepID=T1EHB3_HELRO
AMHTSLSHVIIVSVLVTSLCLAVPAKKKSSEVNKMSPQTEEETRATWLETRNLENNFKELVYLSIQELIGENRVNPEVLQDAEVGDGGARVEKRGRHQGFCFKKTKSGRFLPYICWKG